MIPRLITREIKAGKNIKPYMGKKKMSKKQRKIMKNGR